MSLWDEIECLKDAAPYKKMSVDDFKNHIAEFMNHKFEERREFVVMTGASGMMNLNYTMQKMLALDTLKSLTNITEEERIRLNEMVESSDRENFEVAKIIIDNKFNGK